MGSNLAGNPDFPNLVGGGRFSEFSGALNLVGFAEFSGAVCRKFSGEVYGAHCLGVNFGRHYLVGKFSGRGRFLQIIGKN